MSKFQSEQVNMLLEAIKSIEDFETLRMFFEDVCTIKELQEMSQRLQVAKELKSGKNYNDISKSTGASTATISRVNRCLVYGSGGYNAVLSALEEK